MLKLLLCLSFFTSAMLYGQGVGTPVQTTAPEGVALFASLGAVSGLHQQAMHYVEEYTVREEVLADLEAFPRRDRFVQVSFKGTVYELALQRHYFQTSGYALTLKSGSAAVDRSRAYYYSGSVLGQQGWATLAVVDGTLRLLIAHDDGNIEIVRKDGNYIGYEHHDRKVPLQYSCQRTDADSPTVQDTKAGDSRLGPADCLELSISCDHASYIANGSSVANTEAWALSILNDVATTYSNEGIELVVTQTIVWDTPDPYASTTNKTELRNLFVSTIEDNYEGRVAYLFSTRDLDGGLAYGIGGFCEDHTSFPGPFAVATTLSTTIDPYPTYSFNTQVVAHELGHVLGARHTHACVWSGGQQVDDCGNVWAETNGFTPEGTGCYDADQPILPTSGTIMSYCDLVSGVGINLANGMGTEVGTFLLDTYNAATCSTGGLCATIPPSNDECSQAIELTPKGHCVYDRYDNVLATASTPTNISCAGTATNDVWFSFEALSTASLVTIAPVAGGIGGIVAAGYQGDCGSLTEIFCGTSASGNVTLQMINLTVGQTYYVRVQSLNGSTGYFDICVRDPSAPCHPYEDVLIDLYNATNGSQWTNSDGWDFSISSANCEVCDWYGVICDNQENIVEIDLSFNNLVGTLPSSIGDILTLQKLNLFSNTLSGNIPDVFGAQQVLEFIDLSANGFTGLIPRSLTGLPMLNTVYLENNMLQDTLPMEFGLMQSLDVFWVKNNLLTGCFPASYASLCAGVSTTFTGNTGLPGGGDFLTYCLDGTGSDADVDGYCKGTAADQDCDDLDASIYPNAPELCDAKDNDCDGLIDEGEVLTNTWVGGVGSWSVAANWSSGGIPRACEDVLISGAGVTVTLSSGEGFCRSLTMVGASTLQLAGDLTVAGSDDYGVQVGVGATLQNDGQLTIDRISTNGIIVDGQMANSGEIFVNNMGVQAEVVVGSGLLQNNGGTIVVED